MPIKRVSKDCNDAFYFITPTIKNWYYIFDRHDRWKILADSLLYCQKYKNLEIYAYVFMLNHIHMIVRAPDVSGFIRDFKAHTSRRLVENIKKFEPNVLELFRNEKGGYDFWKMDNQPKMIGVEEFFNQKLNYIHNNPVVKGYVNRPEHWKWSSANFDSVIKVARA